MNTSISLNTLIHRAEGNIEAEIDGELVMMNIETGDYYGLDVSAKRIWEIVEKPCTYKNLIEQLTEEFEVTETQCKSDVEKFLAEMAENNLIVITD